MLNWIGDLPDRTAALGVPGLHWHDYDKEPRPGRKVGHATITAKDFAELAERLELAGRALGRESQVAPALAAIRRA
jgi:5-(carboxyamino)imidazole ribonucleotide synthase